MRKQYHFRQSDRGLLAWDVHRLIDLAKNLTPYEIPLSDIKEIDKTYWFDFEGDTPTCRKIAEHAQLINKVDLNFPIILCSAGRVMDGMHRICRALIEKHSAIKAVRFDSDPVPDYIGKDPKKLPY